MWIVALYLRFFARLAVLLSDTHYIGIAGSAGKSSARNITTAMLQNSFRVASIEGNSETGLPLGLLGIKPKGYNVLDWLWMMIRAPFGIFYLCRYEWAVCEYGIDEPYPPRNMSYLLTILKPHIALHLNISATHTMQFEKLLEKKLYKNIEEKNRYDFLLKKIAEDDLKIITKSGAFYGVYNKNDECAAGEIKQFCKTKHGTKLYSFGDNGDIEYRSHTVSHHGTKIVLKYKSEIHKIEVKKYVLPNVYQETVAASLLASICAGVEIKDAIASFQDNFSLPPGRASVFDGVKDSIILDSSYNASKESTLSFLELLDDVGTKSRKKYFLFGDMRELGSLAKQEHEEVAKKIVKIVDMCVCVGPLTKQYVLPILEKHSVSYTWFEDSTEAGEYLRKNIVPQSVVLVKGSQNTIFLEEAIKHLLKDRSDFDKLCRQEEYWFKIKNLPE